MWLLTNSSSDKIIFIKKNKYSIGRKGTDTELTGDDSVSRIHALFTLTKDGLSVRDEKSKYGTFKRNGGKDEKLGDKPKSLEDGDCIRFGVRQNDWIVHQLVQKTCISMMDQQKKDKFVKILDSVGVQVSDKFDNTCTHLTMPMQTDASIKLLQALTLCVPVVTPKFWLNFKNSVDNDQPLPKCCDYVPKIKEETYLMPGAVTLAIREGRKKLFTGKTFIFTSVNQMKHFQEVIPNAGGQINSISQAKMKTKDLCAKNVIVIKAKETETQSQNENTINKIDQALTSLNRRMIPETEIGLAVLHCSIETFCNPETSASKFKTSDAALLKVTTSKDLALGTDSLNLQAPTTSRARRSPKKSAPAKIVEALNLDSDKEVEIINKENIPSAEETQISISYVPAVEAEFHEEVASQLETPLENISIHVTADSVLTNESKDDPKDSSVFSKRLTRSSAESTEKRLEASSKPMSSSSLFNFSDTSLGCSAGNSRVQRKRKNSESVEPVPGPTTRGKKKKQDTNPVKELTAKRNKIHQIIHDDSGDNEPQPRSTRKRAADEAAMGRDGGLFAFNTNFLKKVRHNPNETQESFMEGIGMVRLEKPRESLVKQLTSYVHEYDDSCDSGIWLSKKMISVNLNDSADGMKSEVPELDSFVNTEDIKPQQYVSLFNVLETSSGFNSITSVVSKRKQFVKQKNFKSQSSVVTMKTVRVEETYEQRDEF